MVEPWLLSAARLCNYHGRHPYYCIVAQAKYRSNSEYRSPTSTQQGSCTVKCCVGMSKENLLLKCNWRSWNTWQSDVSHNAPNKSKIDILKGSPACCLEQRSDSPQACRTRDFSSNFMRMRIQSPGTTKRIFKLLWSKPCLTCQISPKDKKNEQLCGLILLLLKQLPGAFLWKNTATGIQKLSC